MCYVISILKLWLCPYIKYLINVQAGILSLYLDAPASTSPSLPQISVLSFQVIGSLEVLRLAGEIEY